ncbi:MAG: hypothetical protein LQ339_002221 [Xanthoria mediterranea]|nr:MAG: hypothetical protein LQ339_002221 [Xanthoria mediterranea]
MSEPQLTHDPERKSSMAPNDKPKPHIRACESCRTRKIRCLPQDASKDAKCQRCAKSGRECIYNSPEKRKRRKRTDARVADLEHMVQMLAARLEQEQRARLYQEERHRDHQKPRQDNPILHQTPSQNPNLLSPPPSPNEYPPLQNLLHQADSQHRLRSPNMTTKPMLAREHSTSKPMTHIIQSAQQSSSPLPATAALSPNPTIQEPLPSPLSQTRIPNVLNQHYTARPPFHPSLDPEPHQHASTTTTTSEDVYSPCPSHSSTLSHPSTSPSELSQPTILDIPPLDNKSAMFDLPSAAGAEYTAMDAAISAQLNMPCQDQGIWWPQSNIMGNDFPTDAATAAATAAANTTTMGNWMPWEDVFSWQTMQWA